jgi:hypothetical protein
MVVPIEGDGHFQPLEPRMGDNGVDDIHLLLGDSALTIGLVGLGASKDH